MGFLPLNSYLDKIQVYPIIFIIFKFTQLFSFVKVPRYIKAHVCRTQPCKTSKLTNKSTDAENSSTIGIIEEFEEPPISDDDSINDDCIYNKTDDDSNVDINLKVLIKQIHQKKTIQSQRNLFKILQILKRILLFLKMNKNVNALLKF